VFDSRCIHFGVVVVNQAEIVKRIAVSLGDVRVAHYAAPPLNWAFSQAIMSDRA
jgi:hypothetical protein